ADEAMITPKNAMYGNGSAGPGSPLAVTRSKAKTKTQANVDLKMLAISGSVLNGKQSIHGVYLKMDDTTRGMNYARFYASVCDDAGVATPFKVTFPKDKGVARDVASLCFKAEGLSSLLSAVQQNESKLFTEVKFFAMESTVQYQSGLLHQYLKPILNEPGKATRVSKERTRVSTCKHCDAMLLRFSFNWVMQKDDFQAKDCPYCKKPLEIVERVPRLVPVYLDFTCSDAKITGANNQIGAMYNDVPVKLTVKVQSMLHFLQNYQAQFPNGVMGPFDISLTTRAAEVAVKFLHFDKIFTQVDWRPIVLYPEDLIAL
nr:hypothetical protein [Candidatus Sigynarchaeota archaeon]